jgi:carbamoyl-phosphate synthase large subunit
MKKLNIAFTSIGRRVELVHAFQRAYADLQLDGRIVGLDMDPLAPALKVTESSYVVPSLQSTDYIETLLSIFQRESIDFVFPLIDPDIPFLASHKHQLETNGTRLIVLSRAAAEITGDKYRTTEFFKNLGLPVPRTWMPSQINMSQIEYPVFIKPRAGSAGKNAFAAQNQRELEFFLEYITDPIVQECLPGPEITNDVICDLENSVLAVVSRQRIEVRYGEVSKGVTIQDSRIQDACVRIARELKTVGPLTVQCMMKDEVPYFTEINARFGGGLPLGIEAGVNSPKWLLARFADIPIDIPPLGTYKTGLYMTRYDDSFFISELECEKLLRRHL